MKMIVKLALLVNIYALNVLKIMLTKINAINITVIKNYKNITELLKSNSNLILIKDHLALNKMFNLFKINRRQIAVIGV